MQRVNLTSAKDIAGEGGFNLLRTLKWVLISYVASAILLFVCAVLATSSVVPDSAARVMVILVTVLSIILAGFLTARSARRQGWISGMTAGLVYYLLLYLLGSLVLTNFAFGWASFGMLAASAVCGAFGGMLGVNILRKKRR